MPERTELDIFTRCHTVLRPKTESGSVSETVEVPIYLYILAFDTETTEDLELALEFVLDVTMAL